MFVRHVGAGPPWMPTGHSWMLWLQCTQMKRGDLTWVMRGHFASKNDPIIFKPKCLLPVGCILHIIYVMDKYEYVFFQQICIHMRTCESRCFLLTIRKLYTIVLCVRVFCRVFPVSRLVTERHLCFLVPTLEASPMIAMLIIIIAVMGQTALHCLISLWPPFDTWFNVSGHQVFSIILAKIATILDIVIYSQARVAISRKVMR